MVVELIVVSVIVMLLDVELVVDSEDSLALVEEVLVNTVVLVVVVVNIELATSTPEMTPLSSQLKKM